MATIKELLLPFSSYTFSGSALAGLANNAAWQTNSQDNSSALWLDALVQLKVKTGASGTSATGVVWVYAYGSVDGATYPDTVTGAEGTLTLVSPTNLRPIGSVNTPANAATYTSEPISVAAAFGGTLPLRWGLCLVNNAGAALDATIGSFAILIGGIQTQVV